MPAALPGATKAENLANPSAGRCVMMSSFSGPKGSPFDKDNSGNASTGALMTGIGFGSPPIFGITAPQSIKDRGFNDDYIPGISLPSGSAATDSRLTAIGGGKCTANVNGDAPEVPYTAGFGLLKAGQGGSRDAGVGPAFTGFECKTVTAVATVANGAVVEAGFVNRSGQSITVGQSVFGSATAASAAPA